MARGPAGNGRGPGRPAGSRRGPGRPAGGGRGPGRPVGGRRGPGRPVASRRPPRRRGRRSLGSSIAALIIMLIILGIVWLVNNKDDIKEAFSKGDNKKQETTTPADYAEKLEIHYIYVGQGDSTLIKCGSEAMLIDAGENDQGEVVSEYLKEQNVSNLDIVVGTHSHSDHIGGLDIVVRDFDCETIILPDYEQDTKTYTDLIDNIEAKDYEITRPEVGKVYNLGEAKVTILAPVSYDYGDNPNNYSIAIKVEYGNNSFLFTGDAEEEVEEDILEKNLDISADVYKVAHHGSTTSNTYDFLQKVNPTYAVVSCGIDNSYGHPHDEVVERLESMEVEMYRTDIMGTIIAYSDGNNIRFVKEKQ